MERKPIQEVSQPIKEVVINDSQPLMIEGVNVELARHFNMDVYDISPDAKRRMGDIEKWIKQDLFEPTEGNFYEALGDIGRRLGDREVKEDKVLKIWNWLRIKQSMKDLSKQQRSLEIG